MTQVESGFWTVIMRSKSTFYRTTIRPTMLYETKCWTVKKQHVTKTNVAEIRILRWMRDKTRNEIIRNANT